MSTDSLSQAEVESLLSAMDTGAKPADESRRGGGRGREKVSPYDFKRPERVGKEQMRALQTLHESFGRNFGVALSTMLRSIVEVKLTSVDQLTYSEFVFSLDKPTCFNVVEAAPLEGNLILEINPAVLYPLIDRLLGGGREPGPVARRPLTEIELRLVSRITRLFLDEFRAAWENVIQLEPKVVAVEHNPQLVQIVPPNEVVVLISFELTLGDSRGMMNLCVPYNSIERLGGKLSSNTWAGYGRRDVAPESVARVAQNLKGAVVDLVVELAQTRITAKDLIGLRVNDIIATEKDIHRPLDVSVSGIPKFQASAGSFKGKRAIRVDGVIESR